MRDLAFLLVGIIGSSLLAQTPAEIYDSRWTLQNLDKAIEEYSETIRLDPLDSQAYYGRGVAWAKKRKYVKAIADLDNAIKLHHSKYGEAYKAYNARGIVWNNRGEYDKAISDFNEAIILRPRHCHWLYFNRGVALRNKGEYDKAVSDFDEALKYEKGYLPAYVNIAWILATCPVAEHRDGTKAQRYALLACKSSGWKNANCVAALAAAYAELGAFDRAVEHQVKAIQLATDKDKHALFSQLELYKSGRAFGDEPKVH